MGCKVQEHKTILRIFFTAFLAACITTGWSSAFSQIIVSDFQVNQNSGPAVADQFMPTLGADSLGNYKVVWLDNSPYQPRIYGQLYTTTGVAIAENFQIYRDTSNTAQTYPAIAVNLLGDFVVVWIEVQDLNKDLYVRSFQSDGTPRGDKIQVNDDTTDAKQYFPDVAINSRGEFVIAWHDSRDNSQKIYAQRFTPGGTPAGNNFKVFDQPGMPAEGECAVALDDSGRFVVAAVDAYSFHIVGQHFNENGEPLDDFFTVDDADETYPDYPAIDMGRSGDFVICWVDHRGNFVNVYAQCFREDGSPAGSNFKVTENLDTNGKFDPEISINENGNFVIVWEQDTGQESDIFARLFLADGTPYGSNFLIPANSDYDQRAPFVVMVGNHIYSAWMDNRADGTRFDIWSNIAQWQNPSAFQDPAELQYPDQIVLYQNYPNPFNPQTKIIYHLNRSSHVVLTVYDISGAKIQTLVNTYQIAGKHEIVFDAATLASGIYFYRLESADKIQSHKMFLIR